DYVELPVETAQLVITVHRAAQHRRARRHAAQVRRTIESRYGMGAVVGTSVAMQQVFESITHACADDAPLLLYGERGTGKELAAHDWPGNVRELEAVVERALVASRGDTIERHHIAPEILAAAGPVGKAAVDPTSVSFKEALALARERTSQQYIAALLRLCDG